MVNQLQYTKVDFRLTPQETNILRFVCNGLSNKEIASQLNISVRTVETHRLNLFRKMGVDNTPKMIKKAMEQNLVL